MRWARVLFVCLLGLGLAPVEGASKGPVCEGEVLFCHREHTPPRDSRLPGGSV